jgi:hypothetical protein
MRGALYRSEPNSVASAQVARTVRSRRYRPPEPRAPVRILLGRSCDQPKWPLTSANVSDAMFRICHYVPPKAARRSRMGDQTGRRELGGQCGHKCVQPVARLTRRLATVGHEVSIARRASPVLTVVGGGDSAAAVRRLGLPEDSFSRRGSLRRASYRPSSLARGAWHRARHQHAMARKIKKLTSAIWASCTEPSSSLLIVQLACTASRSPSGRRCAMASPT